MVNSAAEQNSVLQGCTNTINQQSHLMKQCLNEGNLLQALKHCSNFLNELRTSLLTPKQYYDIYVQVFDSLEVLSSRLLVSHNSKKLKRGNEATPFLADLYELVQYSGNIIPRLYMMIVIGTTYMSTSDAPKKEIMKDMIEMCRGVQHPIRGLFLRYYLSQRTKDLLPLDNRVDFDQTVDFLVSNFIEMNKLWVRLQHQGHSSERELRYKERLELKILVGSNLVRLSQIIDDYSGDESYVSIEYYRENVFPVITEQIIQCKDQLAQSYLIDVIIQIFPDDFHFATLDRLLNGVFIKLHPTLKKSELISALINRFLTFHEGGQDLEEKMKNLFLKTNKTSAENSFILLDVFWEFYLKLISSNSDIPVDEHSKILQSFIRLSLAFESTNYDHLNRIYQFATEKLSSGGHRDNEPEQSLLLELMIVPVNHLKLVKELLNLSFFYTLYSKLSNREFQKKISLAVLDKLVSNYVDDESETEYYTSEDEIDNLFKYLAVLVDESDSHLNTSKDLGVTKAYKMKTDNYVSQDFLEHQKKISQAIHLVRNEDRFQTISLLIRIRKNFLNKNPDAMIHTYPTLVSRILHELRLVGLFNLKRKSSDQNEDFRITSHFKNLSVIINELYQHHQNLSSELILKLYLNAAAIADQLKQESIAYELFTQCFIVYEENLILSSSVSQSQRPQDSLGGSLPYQLIVLIANKLANLRYFSKDNYESLITKLTLYGSKLLKRQEQCRSVYYCAHLWWWCDLIIHEKSPTVSTDDDDDKKDDKDDNKNDNNSNENGLYTDPRRVLECLQKSLRVADSCMDPYLSTKLFVEILNRCLIFHIYGNQLVDSRYINGLIDLIKTNLNNFNDDGPIANDQQDDERVFVKQIHGYFNRTLEFIDDQKKSEGQFQDIVV